LSLAEDYQQRGFDSLSVDPKSFAVVDWELVELEEDELPAGSEAAVAVDPVVKPQPAAAEDEAHPCCSEVAGVAGVVLLVVASCFVEAAAAADYEPPGQFAVDVRLADEDLLESYAELLQTAQAAVGQWTATTSETEMLQAVAVDLDEPSFVARDWETEEDHVGEETDRGPEDFVRTRYCTSDE